MAEVLRRLRAHPIRAAALLGGAIGFASVLVTETGAILHHEPSGAVLMFWPSTHFAPGAVRSDLATTLFILSLELAVNLLVWALLLAAPVACLVALRYAWRSRKTSSEES